MCLIGIHSVFSRLGRLRIRVWFSQNSDNSITLYKLCAFPVSHITIPGEDVYSIVIHPHRECTSSPGMWMYLTGNAHPNWEWRCASPGMHILTGNGDVGMHIITGNTRSLYRVSILGMFGRPSKPSASKGRKFGRLQIVRNWNSFSRL